jgi:tRNA(adenine34) deaminase
MDDPARDEYWMRLALRQAQEAAEEDEVPVGAVIVRAGQLVAKAHNQVERLKDATAHAEMIALTQAAAAVGDWRLTDAVLYVTKEPCAMCAGAIVLSRVARVAWGVTDPQRGGAVSLFRIFDQSDLNHRVAHTAGVLEAECRDLLQRFFRERRQEGGGEDRWNRPAPDVQRPSSTG